jgi:hypothetical protein
MIAPRGWYYQNIIAYDRFIQETVFPLADPSKRRVYPGRVTDTEAAPEKQFAKNTPYNVLAGFLAGMTADTSRSLLKFARSQSLADQAAIACALERYRLTNRQYPETLEALVPGFMEKLPHDIVDGQPLKYRHNADGQFLLYSVGWNETDEDGMIVMTRGKTPHQDISQGDWVWLGR